MNYKEARIRAEEISNELKADINFKHVVYLVHLDKTQLELWYADFRKEDEWLMIFTEHHGIFVYHEEDIEDYYSVPMKEACKTIRMSEIEIDISENIIDGLSKLGLQLIKNDKKELINYAAVKVFEDIVGTKGECLKDIKNN